MWNNSILGKCSLSGLALAGLLGLAAMTPASAKPLPSASSATAMPELVSTSQSGDFALRRLIAEHNCLSEAMYYEARGEGEAGQKAVAEVILNRLRSGNYGDTMCAVVYAQNSRGVCQFTFVCDGSLKAEKSAKPWQAAQILAERLMAGELQLPNQTNGAVNYHAVSVHPNWEPNLTRVAQVGNHVFYAVAER